MDTDEIIKIYKHALIIATNDNVRTPITALSYIAKCDLELYNSELNKVKNEPKII